MKLSVALACIAAVFVSSAVHAQLSADCKKEQDAILANPKPEVFDNEFFCTTCNRNREVVCVQKDQDGNLHPLSEFGTGAANGFSGRIDAAMSTGISAGGNSGPQPLIGPNDGFGL